jgi:excisionase family DNA binding protein
MPKQNKRTPLPPTDSLFITRREAARLLRLHLGAIDELIRAEKLPAYRPQGRRILIRRDELLSMVAASPVWVESTERKRKVLPK